LGTELVESTTPAADDGRAHNLEPSGQQALRPEVAEVVR
jgi:hypothetical protein